MYEDGVQPLFIVFRISILSKCKNILRKKYYEKKIYKDTLHYAILIVFFINRHVKLEFTFLNGIIIFTLINRISNFIIVILT